MYGNVVYHKVDISNQWGKDGPFNNKQLWENWIAIRKKKKVGSVVYIVNQNNFPNRYLMIIAHANWVCTVYQALQ